MLSHCGSGEDSWDSLENFNNKNKADQAILASFIHNSNTFSYLGSESTDKKQQIKTLFKKNTIIMRIDHWKHEKDKIVKLSTWTKT